MEDEIILQLEESAIRDCQKPELSKLYRARIIKDYMERKKLSLSEMGKTLNIPKTTLHGWLLYNKLSEEEYDSLKETGTNETDIFNALKTNKGKNIGEDGEMLSYHLDILEKHIKKLDNILPEKITKNVLQRITLLNTKINNLLRIAILRSK